MYLSENVFKIKGKILINIYNESFDKVCFPVKICPFNVVSSDETFERSIDCRNFYSLSEDVLWFSE